MGPLGTIDISNFTLEIAIGSGHIGCPVATGGHPARTRKSRRDPERCIRHKLGSWPKPQRGATPSGAWASEDKRGIRVRATADFGSSDLTPRTTR
jgi:hypothetical protein